MTMTLNFRGNNETFTSLRTIVECRNCEQLGDNNFDSLRIVYEFSNILITELNTVVNCLGNFTKYRKLLLKPKQVEFKIGLANWSETRVSSDNSV